MTGTTSTRIGAAVLAPLLLFIAVFVLFTGSAFEEGPRTATHVQAYLWGFAILGLLASLGVGIGHAVGGSKGTLRTFVALMCLSLILVGAYVIGFSAWCSHCGSR